MNPILDSDLNFWCSFFGLGSDKSLWQLCFAFSRGKNAPMLLYQEHQSGNQDLRKKQGSLIAWCDWPWNINVLRTRASPNDHRLHTSDNTECKEDDKMLADHSEERVSNIQSSFCFTCTLPSSKAQNIQLLLCQSVRCAIKSKDVLCLIFKILLVY